MADQGLYPIPSFYNGNIDLNKRQIYVRPDGYIQTEHSLGTGFDPGDKYSISIPTIVNGQPVSDAEAKKHFMNTGEHLGVTYRDNNESVAGFYNRVNELANVIHERQDAYYHKGPGLAITEAAKKAAGLGSIPNKKEK